MSLAMRSKKQGVKTPNNIWCLHIDVLVSELDVTRIVISILVVKNNAAPYQGQLRPSY